jgi:CDP-diacylglycerol---serine O-phosphatidyltransferase
MIRDASTRLSRTIVTVTTPNLGSRHFSMIRGFHLADLFTLANGCCGTAAIFFAMSHMRDAHPSGFMLRGRW